MLKSATHGAQAKDASLNVSNNKKKLVQTRCKSTSCMNAQWVLDIQF